MPLFSQSVALDRGSTGRYRLAHSHVFGTPTASAFSCEFHAHLDSDFPLFHQSHKQAVRQDLFTTTALFTRSEEVAVERLSISACTDSSLRSEANAWLGMDACRVKPSRRNFGSRSNW
jgi:hypothetical protein